MNEKTVGIFAETPFQLIAGLNIAINHSKATSCVLFLTREMYQTNKEFVVLGNIPFLKSVYYVNRTPNYRTLHSMIAHVLCPKTAAIHAYFSNVPPKKLLLSTVVGMKYSDTIPIVMQYLKIRVPLVLVEEGIGDYRDPVLNNIPTTPDWINSTNCFSDISRVFMMPEYYTTLTGLQASYAHASNHKTLQTLVSSLLGPISITNRNLVEKSQIIYFDSHNDNGADEDDPKEENLLTLLEKEGINLLVNKHPRSMKDYSSCTSFNETTISAEQLFLELPCMENKILISPPSTLMLSPKFLFNKEPFIINLIEVYRAYYEETLGRKKMDDLQQIVDYLQSTYSNPEKIQTPKTIEELINTIKAMMRHQ